MMTFDSRNQHNQQDGEERSAEQRKYRIFALLFALAAFSLVFSSCMSVPRDVAVSGLFDHFERTPQVLARAESAFLRDMAASFDDSTIQALISMTSENPDNGQKPINRDRLDKTLARAEAAGIGISWNSKESPSIEAVFAGNFPSLFTSLSFSLDGNWKRIEGGYASKSGKLYVRDPYAGKLHFTTWAPEQLNNSISAASSIAERSGLLASASDLAIYLDAKSALVSQLPILDGVTLPFDGILLTAERDRTSPKGANPHARYTAIFKIQMKDEQTARTYRPIMRVMWALVSGKLTALGIPVSPETSIEQQGSLFATTPISMSAREIVNVFLALSNMNGGKAASGLVAAPRQ
ncbi:MAG: hypothetical protein ACOYVH_05800 [Spirochaetota bacterium]